MQIITLTPTGPVWHDDPDVTLDKMIAKLKPDLFATANAHSGLIAKFYASPDTNTDSTATEYLVGINIGSLKISLVAEGFQSVIYILGLIGEADIVAPQPTQTAWSTSST